MFANPDRQVYDSQGNLKLGLTPGYKLKIPDYANPNRRISTGFFDAVNTLSTGGTLGGGGGGGGGGQQQQQTSTTPTPSAFPGVGTQSVAALTGANNAAGATVTETPALNLARLGAGEIPSLQPVAPLGGGGSTQPGVNPAAAGAAYPGVPASMVAAAQANRAASQRYTGLAEFYAAGGGQPSVANAAGGADQSLAALTGANNIPPELGGGDVVPGRSLAQLATDASFVRQAAAGTYEAILLSAETGDRSLLPQEISHEVAMAIAPHLGAEDVAEAMEYMRYFPDPDGLKWIKLDPVQGGGALGASGTRRLYRGTTRRSTRRARRRNAQSGGGYGNPDIYGGGRGSGGYQQAGGGLNIYNFRGFG